MGSRNEYLQLLRQMPVFGGLSDKSLEFILDQASSRQVNAGDYFFHEGDAATSMFVLTTGEVRVEKTWDGVPIELGRFGTGDCLGEMAIIDLEPRSASVGAITNCESIEITRATLHGMYRDDVEQFAIIMMNMGREVSRRLRSCSQRLFEIDQTMTI